LTGLPSSWATVPLADIASTQLGKMLSSKAKTGVGALPYLRNKNVQWGRVDLADLAEMDFSEEEFERFQLLSGDLLVCEGGDVGRAAIWNGNVERIAFQKALHRVRPYGGIAPAFLLYQLMWLAGTKAFESLVTGSTIRHLPQEGLRVLEIVLPPASEQGRIVAAIEEELSRLDAADHLLRAAKDRLPGLRVAAYREALEGQWQESELAEVADVRLGRQRSPKNHSGPHMTPYLRAANVTWKGIDLSDVKSMNFESSEVDVYRLEPGDVLVAEASGSASEVGKAALWQGEMAICCFQNTLLRVRSRGPLPEYLQVALQSAALSGEFGRASPGIGIHHLGAKRLSAWKIPIPPPGEQGRVVGAIEQRLSLLEAADRTIEAAQRRSAALRRSILERALRGDLVPQDPSDEPATVLLERIQAERAETDRNAVQSARKKRDAALPGRAD
jgi:type I restriction enzyme, S subunit